MYIHIYIYVYIFIVEDEEKTAMVSDTAFETPGDCHCPSSALRSGCLFEYSARSR